MPSLKQVVEALVFASQKPLVPREIAGALKSAADESEAPEVQALGKTKEAEIGAVLEELKEELGASGRSFQLIEQVNGWHFVTGTACAPWVRQLFPESKPVRLSGPALETLAIIAYRQPIARADMEAVRGVAVDGVMQTLLDRGLVKIADHCRFRALAASATHLISSVIGNTGFVSDSGKLIASSGGGDTTNR